MKQLQNNFTTPEQSKRLLELGVPADSADCYYKNTDFKPHPHWVRGHWNEEDWQASIHGYKISPCWSVGRLIEIFKISFVGYFNSRYFGHTLMEDVLLKIEEQIDSMDFSKFEK